MPIFILYADPDSPGASMFYHAPSPGLFLHGYQIVLKSPVE